MKTQVCVSISSLYFDLIKFNCMTLLKCSHFLKGLSSKTPQMSNWTKAVDKKLWVAVVVNSSQGLWLLWFLDSLKSVLVWNSVLCSTNAVSVCHLLSQCVSIKVQRTNIMKTQQLQTKNDSFLSYLKITE